ncbi:Uroporphyrinogen-III synthase [Methylophaga frappieri]|uniref:Uroporphyrinogen-III synthase n=1 Tax=Methylophaga frappieri (strain ATCC BAA-2434 / DSM 25690 / JAM7) TaxID=754477 RepID=I1YJA7_METFJ|nr:uroporphyrinogen-III synthase [Methylophaga frappieri]AFJ03000.1 Uroporphyrinogen-III synthase [Methylophaga frappieri]
MTAEMPLSGLRILVTRPISQAVELARSVRDAGGEPVLLPLIDIEPIAANKWPEIDWRKIDWLIFVSRNAVNLFFTGLQKKLPARIKYAAVGNGTAQALATQGVDTVLCPEQPGGSEGLLSVSALQDVAGQKIVIIRGQGGRPLLADTLHARGATVRYIEVYKRQLPRILEQDIADAGQCDMLLATSVQSVDHLVQLFTNKALFNKPLIVLSERIKHVALAKGFSQVLVTHNASDTAIMQKLIETGAKHGQQHLVH